MGDLSGSKGSLVASSRSSFSSASGRETPLQLYVERLAAPCRAVWLYMRQHGLSHDINDVDLNSSEGIAVFRRKFQHREVPILVDGESVVFTAPAILTYLGNRYTDNAGFGLTLESQLLTSSLVSWANSELYRIAGHCVAYPSCMAAYRLSSESATEELIEHGMRRLARHAEQLENDYLEKNRFLTGERITIADSFVATVLLQAQWNGFSFQMWPRVLRWLERVRAQEFWSDVHRAHSTLVTELDQNRFSFD